MTPKERELLQGMGNCFEVCHANFEETVSMVGSARGLTPDEVKTMLRAVKEKYANEKEYTTLRSRLPKEFPI